MEMEKCDRFALMAYLDSKRAILNYSKKEYGRVLVTLESSGNVTKYVRKLIKDDCNRVEARVEKVSQQYESLKKGGGEYCGIDYEMQGFSICAGATGECDFEEQLTAQEFLLSDNIIRNLWASA